MTDEDKKWIIERARKLKSQNRFNTIYGFTIDEFDTRELLEAALYTMINYYEKEREIRKDDFVFAMDMATSRFK